MQNNKISSYPSNKKPLEDFILGAEQRKGDNNIHKQQKVTTYPWQENGIREDVQKVFTVKLLEEYILKIKFISEATNKSQQKIIREIISQEVDKIISQLI